MPRFSRPRFAQSRSRRGFTLIELLVVIAIIAILAAILFPVFARAREAARTSSCLSNTKQMGSAVMMYCQDYDEIFPWMWQGGAGSAWVHIPEGETASSNYYTWAEYIMPYIKNKAVFQCPSFKRTQAQMPYATLPFSYNYNGAAGLGVSGSAMASVEAPSTTVLLYDGQGTMDCWWYAPDHASLISGISVANPASASPVAWPQATMDSVRRHNSGVNVAFADGHSKWVNKATTSMLTRGGDPD
jgi:prepilin-type N-terminal cleavage/methylation domain-containing protein/prepilin-type processing-associated H-X9-DG protein